MIKRISCLILIMVYLISSVGCSGELRRKFVRKKKAEKKQVPIFKPVPYEDEFTPRQRYANHYAFWKNAVTEVIKVLGQSQINNKKLKVHASHALDEIKRLHQLLTLEQKMELEPHINELNDLVEKLKDSRYVLSHKHTLTKKLKHHYREVSKNFSYSKMKAHLEG